MLYKVTNSRNVIMLEILVTHKKKIKISNKAKLMSNLYKVYKICKLKVNGCLFEQNVHRNT